MRLSVFQAVCWASSSRNSASSRLRRSQARRRRNTVMNFSPSQSMDESRWLHHPADCRDEAVEAGLGVAEGAATGAGQAVITRPSIVRRLAPLGIDQPLNLQALQRRIQGPFLDM